MPIFRGLVTGTNELGEDRIQFHIVTNFYDKIGFSIKAYKIHVFFMVIIAQSIYLLLLPTENSDSSYVYFTNKL